MLNNSSAYVCGMKGGLTQLPTPKSQVLLSCLQYTVATVLRTFIIVVLAVKTAIQQYTQRAEQSRSDLGVQIPSLLLCQVSAAYTRIVISAFIAICSLHSIRFP